MYYKCYVNNEVNDPFIPENVGIYKLNVFYNKFKYSDTGIGDDLKQCVESFKNKNIGKYVVSLGNKPTDLEYQQISKLGNYQN
jgi:hypothetical protein